LAFRRFGAEKGAAQALMGFELIRYSPEKRMISPLTM
jgi:hypothetical protein